MKQTSNDSTELVINEKKRKPKQLTLQEIINQAKGLPNADLKTLVVAIASEIESRRQQAEKELEELK